MAGFGLLALAGLFVFATSRGLGGGEEPLGTVSIWGFLPEEGMDSALEQLKYDQRYDGVSYREVDEATFGSTLASSIAEGRGPDLILITQEHLLSEEAKITPIPFEYLPQRTFVDSYVPMADLFLDTEGALAVPFVIDPLVLYYNTTTLLSAGVGSAPTTWDAVTALAERLSQVSENRQTIIKSAIPFGDYANVANARAVLSLLLLQSGTPITSSVEGGVISVLGAARENGSVPAESAVAFYAQFADPLKTVYSWNRALPRSTQAFISGTLALYPGFASERAYLASANPNLSFDMARIPQASSGGDRTTYGKLYAFAVPRASANPNGAMEVAFALSTPAPSVATAETLGMASALRTMLTARAEDRYASVFYPEALTARGWLSPAPTATDGIFAGMISNIVNGRSDVSGAVRTADDSLEASL